MAAETTRRDFLFLRSTREAKVPTADPSNMRPTDEVVDDHQVPRRTALKMGAAALAVLGGLFTWSGRAEAQVGEDDVTPENNGISPLDDVNFDELAEGLEAIPNLPNSLTAEQKIALGLEGDDPDVKDAYYYTVSTMMGAGISFDVMAATIAMFKRLDQNNLKLRWVLAVGLSHAILPVVGGAIAAGTEYVGGEQRKVAERVKGAVGFGASIFLFQFLKGVLQGEEEEEEEDGEESDEEKLLSMKVMSPEFFMVLWGVSADALISGLPKWETADNAGWQKNDVFGSIGIGALVVMLLATLSLKVADGLRGLNERAEDDFTEEKAQQFVKLSEELLVFAEACVLNYFVADAAINSAFAGDFKFGGLVLSAAGITGIMYKLFGKERIDALKDKELWKDGAEVGRRVAGDAIRSVFA